MKEKTNLKKLGFKKIALKDVVTYSKLTPKIKKLIEARSWVHPNEIYEGTKIYDKQIVNNAIRELGERAGGAIKKTKKVVDPTGFPSEFLSPFYKG